MVVCVFIACFFFNAFASNEPQTIIIHMPGMSDRGLQFLNPHINYNLSSDQRLEACLNELKTVYPCDKLPNTFIYTNNLATEDMDFGGKECVRFYKKMILRMYKKYPEAHFVLTGASQGSVGPFGALVKLIKEQHPAVNNIKKIAIVAALGSTHKVINHNFQKYPLINYLPQISEKIAPLLTEYFLPLPFSPFLLVTQYNAFAKQMEHYAQKLKEFECNIPVFIMHDAQDSLIPVKCAQNLGALNQQHTLEITNTGSHLPDDNRKYQQRIIDFLKHEPIEFPSINESPSYVDDWFVSQNPLQRFLIRRMRDLVVFALSFGAYKGLKLILLLFTIGYKKWPPSLTLSFMTICNKLDAKQANQKRVIAPQ